MEIGPLPGVRMITYSKTPPPVVALQPVSDTENFARISDESYTPSQEASDSGYYDPDEPTDDQEAAPRAFAMDEDETSRLNLIA